MAKAVCVYITPPTNTPVDTTRRRFLTVAAVEAIERLQYLLSEDGPLWRALVAESRRLIVASPAQSSQRELRLGRTIRRSAGGSVVGSYAIVQDGAG
jgi:hypothetical protein